MAFFSVRMLSFIFSLFLFLVSGCQNSNLDQGSGGYRRGKNPKETTLFCRYMQYSANPLPPNPNAQPLELVTSVTYPEVKNGSQYFYGCPDALNPISSSYECPHYLGDDEWIYSNIYFMVNNNPGHVGRQSFLNTAEQACAAIKPANSVFVEYGIRSPKDIYLIAQPFHLPFFAQPTASTSPDTEFPFSRLVAFGDSLSDNGNLFGESGTPKYPYFFGRFSSGFIWLEHIVKRLNEVDGTGTNPFELYDYAEGGSGTQTYAYNPARLIDQVTDFNNTMLYSGYTSANPVFEPAYDSTLFTFFSGSNDYFALSAASCFRVLLNCGYESCSGYCSSNPSTPVIQACATACANQVVSGIKTSIVSLINAGKQNFNQDVKYLMIPTQPNIGLAPYYNGARGFPPAYQTTFVDAASVAHNNALTTMIAQLETTYPQLEIYKFPVDQLLAAYTQYDGFGPTDPVMQAVGIKNVYASAFSGTATSSGTISTDYDGPASFLFWDDIHPTMTGHCAIAEQALVGIFDTFSTGSSYTQDYTGCHNSYINPP